MHGIDVSNHQTYVDWRGVEFCFYKATEGVSFVDSKQDQWANKIALDGPYHFAHPNVNSPEAEAAHFLNHAKPGVMWALDCETYGSMDPLALIGSARLVAWCDRFYELVSPVLGPNGYHYTFRSYASRLWPQLKEPWRWWLASATGAPTYTSYAGRPVDIEQYAIIGGVDRNVSYTDIIQPSGEPDMPLTGDDIQTIRLVATAAAEDAIRVMANVPADASPADLQNIVNIHQIANAQVAFKSLLGLPPEATVEQFQTKLAGLLKPA